MRRIAQQMHVPNAPEAGHLAGERVDGLPGPVQHSQSFHDAELRWFYYVIPAEIYLVNISNYNIIVLKTDRETLHPLLSKSRH